MISVYLLLDFDSLLHNHVFLRLQITKGAKEHIVCKHFANFAPQNTNTKIYHYGLIRKKNC